MNKNIFHIASPIALSLHETVVHLEDFVLDCNSIKTITPPEGIIMWENRGESLLKLEIHDSKKLPFVSCLDIEFNDESHASIVLIRSKKIKYLFRYHPHYHSNTVQIAGDFNSWNPQGYSLSWQNDAWELELEIDPGNYSYQLITDGNWVNDPNNPHTIDNGYGGYNSKLTVPFPTDKDFLHVYTEKYMDTNLIIRAEGNLEGYVALWDNRLINNEFTFAHSNKLMVTIPPKAKEIKRSYIRVYSYSSTATANDILIPLEYGKVVSESSLLNRNDKEAQSIYFILLDRFKNGNSYNDKPINDPEIHAKMNFHGGDIAGVTQKIKDGYIPDLGVSTLWISPVVKNPDTYSEKEGQKSTGYHGYWPVDSKKIDERFGTEQEFHELVNQSHKHNINIILDYVANHVHKDNPIIKDHPDWCTPLYLPDGSLNIGRWEDQRFSTWFEDFLPTLDFDKPEVLETMTDIAVEWIKKYNLDGFRHDATKHISSKFWRTLTKKLKKEIMVPSQKRIYQIGETFGGREMLQTYINSGIHDGQFSFNLYYELRTAFLYDNSHFEKLVTSLKQDLSSFGYHNLMGNITGNHDMPRFISYAGEDLWMNQNGEHEGWNRHITVKNPIGYKKLQLLVAFIATIPGIPVIFYGDEFGLAGAGDPDNRRPMRFIGLSEHEEETLENTKYLMKFRASHMALMYGDFFVLKTEQAQLVYIRSYFNSIAIVLFNKSQEDVEINFEVPINLSENIFTCERNNHFTQNGNKFSVKLPAYSYEILSYIGKNNTTSPYHTNNAYYNR